MRASVPQRAQPVPLTGSITFTCDLEDHLERYEAGGRWIDNSARILDFCARRHIKGTFFTVGRAAVAPQLLQRIVTQGHELALHSYDHIRLTQEDPKTYAGKLSEAKQRFEACTGVAVKGFRAPQFSLTPKSEWVTDILAKLGFAYSSSIIAGHGAFQGFPGKAVTPFQWNAGIWEFPVPRVACAGRACPFLGGVYLKLLPLPLIRFFQKRMPIDAVLWTYLHPYDIDAEEGFVRFTDGTPLWANALLMMGRGGFLGKLDRLLSEGAGPPLIDRVPVSK